MYGNLLDPIERAKKLECIVCKNNERKYYRFRPAKWYGGIVTGDVVGCNLLCYFCWAGDEIRLKPEKIGKFYSPDKVFNILVDIAKKFSFKQIRLSGQEPTIGREHLLSLLKLIDETKFFFILETNGILIGAEKDYSVELSRFKNLHVRVSLKGTNENEFSLLTGSKANSFNLQLDALKNLIDANVSCHASVMSSFSKKENLKILEKRIEKIDKKLASTLEIEELILYPHVSKRLEKMNIKYKVGHEPNKVPKKLI